VARFLKWFCAAVGLNLVLAAVAMMVVKLIGQSAAGWGFVVLMLVPPALSVVIIGQKHQAAAFSSVLVAFPLNIYATFVANCAIFGRCL
jgi:hypothetical protein